MGYPPKGNSWSPVQPEPANVGHLDRHELQRLAGRVMLAAAAFEAMALFPISGILAAASFSDKRYIFAGSYGELLSYISEIRDMPTQGGNEVWGEFF